MKERPILLSAYDVHAILDGRKTQTRRIVKGVDGKNWIRMKGGFGMHIVDERALAACPYGVPGDRLWVRETFYIDTPDDDEDRLENTYYRADGECCDQIPECQCADVGGTKWRPSIHMPRWASRITREVTDVRVQRLQDISAEDALAEGLSPITKDGGRTIKYGIPDRDGLPGSDDDGWDWPAWSANPRKAYATLWDRINGAGAWATNPWVWAITFKRVIP